MNGFWSIFYPKMPILQSLAIERHVPRTDAFPVTSAILRLLFLFRQTGNPETSGKINVKKMLRRKGMTKRSDRIDAFESNLMSSFPERTRSDEREKGVYENCLWKLISTPAVVFDRDSRSLR